MGRRKEVLVKNGRYIGKNLDESVCSKLERIIKMSKSGGKEYISDLRDIIYDLPPSSIDVVLDTKTNDFVELPKGSLTNIQTLGTAFMYFAKSCILGDSVGLGKTVETAGLLNLLNIEYKKANTTFRYLYLTKVNLLEETQRKLIKFTGDYVSSVYGEAKEVNKWLRENEEELLYNTVGVHSLLKNPKFHNYISEYESVYGYNPFDILIIDESGEVLSNSSTQYYKEALELASHFKRVILLDATPFKDNLTSFYNQLNFVDKTFLPTKKEFNDTYIIWDYSKRSYPVPSGKYKNADSFRKLVGYRYFQRTRKSSGAVMKDCSADVIISDLSKVQKELLRKTSMPQVVRDCPSYFGMGIETTLETTPKMKSMVDLLEGDLKDVKSVLIYSHYKECQSAIGNILEEREISHMIMNGDTSNANRQMIINRFRLGDFKVLVTNVQKGLDFDQCNHCIFFSYDASPGNMVQFEGRMTRSFDIIDKHIYILMSRGDELRTFKNDIADKARASDMFAGSDFSCVMELLLDENKLKGLK